MKKISISLFLLTAMIFLVGVTASANVFNWKFIETDNFVVFYQEKYDWKAREILYHLEKHRERTMELTGNKTKLKPHVVVKEAYSSSGWGDPRQCKIAIYTDRPSTALEFGGYQNHFREVSIHEFTHLAHLTNTSGISSKLASILGNTFAPNNHSPLWVIEGITIYNESQTTAQEGMLNQGYYDAVVASKASSGNFPSMLGAGYEYGHFPDNQWYNYGGVFFRYLADQYGEEKLAQLFTEYGSYYWSPFIGDVFPAIGLDKAVKKTYCKSLTELYKEWERYEKKEHQDWQIEGQRVVTNRNGRIFALTSANEKLYYYQEQRLDYKPLGEYKGTKLIEYNPQTKQERVIKSLNWVGNKSLEVVGNKLYSTQEKYVENLSDTVQYLSVYDLDIDRERTLFIDRMKDFAVLPSGRIIYVKNNKSKFGSEIWSYQAGEKEKLGEVNQLVAEIEAEQNNFIVVSKQRLGSWNINRLQLKQLMLTPIAEAPAAERLIKLKDNKLYFSANYNHQAAIYAYDLATDQFSKLTKGSYAIDGVVCANNLYFKGVFARGEGIYSCSITPKDYSLPPSEQDIEEEIKLAGDIEQKAALAKNLSYLLKPQITSVPYFLPLGKKEVAFSGYDGLGMTNYQLTYKDFNQLDLKLWTEMFDPLEIFLKVNNLQETQDTELRLQGDYTYETVNWGLSRAYLRSGATYNDDQGFEYDQLVNTDLSFFAPQQRKLPEYYIGLRSNYDRAQANVNSQLNVSSRYYLEEEAATSIVDFNSQTNLSSKRKLKEVKLESGIDTYLQNFIVSEIKFNQEVNFDEEKELEAAETDLGLNVPLVTEDLSSFLNLDYKQFYRSGLKQEQNLDLAAGLESVKAEVSVYEEAILADDLLRGIRYNYSYQDNQFIIDEQFKVENSDNGQLKTVSSKVGLNHFWLQSKLEVFADIDFQQWDRADSKLKERIVYRGRIDNQHKLAEVRSGFWNPNLFVGDIYEQIFTEYERIRYLDESGDSETIDYGYELAMELGVGFHYTVIPRIGFEVNAGQQAAYIKFEVNSILPDNLLRKSQEETFSSVSY